MSRSCCPFTEGKTAGRGARGHSVIAGWRDTLIKLERPNEGDALKVTVKPRWASPPPPFQLRFKQGTLALDGNASPASGNAKDWTPFEYRLRKTVEEHGGRMLKVDARAAFDKYKGKDNDDAWRKAVERAVVKNGAVLTEGDEIALPK